MRGTSLLVSPVDIRPDHLQIVQGILREHLPVDVEVWVFGSRATWSTKDSSDMDLALEGKGKLSHKVLGALKDAFEDSSLPYKVDVVDVNRIADTFRQIVESQRVPLPVDGYGNGHKFLNGWREVTLSECAEFNDSTYSPKEAWPFINYLDTGSISENRISGIQLLESGKDEIPSRARRKVQPGDIVYSTVRPNQKHFGLLKIVPENFLASTGFTVLRGKEGMADTGFLYWFLAQDHIIDYLHSIAENSTSAYPSIRPSDLEHLGLSLPPLSEQRAIAHVLGTLDDKIELNRRMSETLEAMARALFKSWFVDFEPVRAKIEGRWRRGEFLPGLPAEHYGLFPDRLVDSDLGEIPEGWEVKALGELVELAYGKALRAVDRKDGPVPVYGSNGQVGWHDAKLVAGPGIVVGRKGNPGIVTWAHGDFFPIDTTFYVVPRDANGGMPFLFFALTSQDLPSVSADSAVPGLNRNLAYMNKQLVPDERVLTEFNDYAAAIFSRHYSLEQESRDLAAQRDAQLPGLVSGEVRVGIDRESRGRTA